MQVLDHVGPGGEGGIPVPPFPLSRSNTYGGGGAHSVTISSPAEGDTYPVQGSDYNLAGPITFNATTSDGSEVSWTLDLNYTTSGGRCAKCTNARSLTTKSGANGAETYKSMGGQVMATAADDLSDTANVTFYVVGSPIPTATEVALLDSIYPGSTSKLLSGIAFVESSLHQFTQLTNFGVDDYWPTESNDGGSLLGRAAGQASLGSAAGPMISGTWAIGSIRTADVKPAQVKALLGPDAAEVGAMVCDYAFADIACDGFYRLLVSDWTAASDSSSVLSETVRSSGD